MVSKEQFSKFVEIQESGMTNMCDIGMVVSLSDNLLTREDCLEIMNDYEQLEERYGGDNNDN